MEAPDEAGHSGNLEHKIQAIEDFDAQVVGPVLEGMKKFGEYRVLCMPDHPTPLSLMTHTSDPVPFVLYKGETEANPRIAGYDEDSARGMNLVIEDGFRMMELMLKK
ncbi:MAG: hypothetical protein A2X83_01225 [Desulfuromonadales bacterium GWD2_54_10]|nr:MAG: hypothetical protein A2X83_01225 [Desulfuromonadales bacterium GWD2_54_10]